MLGWSAQLGNKLFGQDPKLEFRKTGQGADLLTAARTIPTDDPYWQQYLTLFDSPSDVLYLLPASLLLRTLHSNPRNLLTLFSFTTNHLFSLLDADAVRPEWHHECLSCVRVLTRLVPLLLGPQGTGVRDEVEEEIFWKRQATRDPSKRPAEADQTSAASPEGNQFVLEDEDDEEREDERDAKEAAPNTEPLRDAEDEAAPCLAERLIATVINLLFVPGLTLPASSSSSSALVNYSIWEPGIASPFPTTPLARPVTPASILSARSEVLRLLIVLVSLPSLLTPPHAYTSTPNRFRDLLVTGQALRAVNAHDARGGEYKNIILCLLCSLLNTACQAAGAPSDDDNDDDNDEEYDDQDETLTNANRDGGGLRASATRFAVEAAKSATGLSQTDGLKRSLLTNCIQLLGIVVINHGPLPPSTSSSSATTATTNLFEFYLSKLHRRVDFSFLFSGLVSHVYDSLPEYPSSSILSSFSAIDPSSLSKKSLSSSSSSSSSSSWPGSSTEALTVLWRLVDLNPKFTQWLVTNGRGREWSELVALLQVVRNESRADEAQIGLVRLASFLIQTLTAETAVVALNSAASSSRDHAENLERWINGPVRRVASRGLVRRRRGGGREGAKLREMIKRQCDSAGIETFESVTLIEYLIMSAHSLILSPSSNKSGRLSTLYPSIVLSLSNLSPYMVGLSNDASTRLLRIWLAFSAPSWVLMEEGNPRLVYYLLETFNNIVFHHFETNSKFVYALLQAEKRFRLLEGFTLELGVTEARRLRAERRKQQQLQQQSLFDPSSPASTLLSPMRSRSSLSSISSNAGRGGRGTVDVPPRPSEKALGKRRESDSTLGDGGSGGEDDSHSQQFEPPPHSPPDLNCRSETGGDDDRDDHDDRGGPFVGKNGFVPTEGWVASWKQGLPLEPISNLLSALEPLAQECATRTTTLDVIRSNSTTLVDALGQTSTTTTTTTTKTVGSLAAKAPRPKPRRFVLTEPLQTWLGSTLYGRVYLEHLEYWRDGLVEVQLFGVVSTSSSSTGTTRSAIGAVAGLERTVEQVGRDVGQLARGILGRVGGGGGGSASR